MEIIKKILDIIIPQKCVGCGKKGEILCDDCVLSAPKNEKYIGEDNFALFSYQNKIVKDFIYCLKYKGGFSISEKLAKMLYETALEELSQQVVMSTPLKKEEIIVVPVPLHNSKLKKRGYNQSEILAEEIVKNSRREFVLEKDLLIKTKETESQVSRKKKKERIKNPLGTFEIKNEIRLSGKIILLIDDVITTGATIEECRKTLIKAGAKKVFALALAH